MSQQELAYSLVVGGEAAMSESFSEEAVASAYIGLFKRLIQA
jgi:hypothetical protein